MKSEIISNLEIKKLVYKGYGLTFAEDSTIFVKQAIPGQIIEAKVIAEKNKIKFALVEKIIKESEYKQIVDCKVFGKCGGCDWLHIRYDKQLKEKENIIKEVFNFVSPEKFQSIVSSKKNKNYRNKVFFPISSYNEKPRIGIFASKSHKVITHESCELIPHIFDQIILYIISYIEASNEKIYNEKHHSGNLRHIGFRISEKTSEIIVILVTKNRKLAFSKQLVNTLVSNFPQISGIIQNINSHKGNTILSNDEKILFGKNYFYDSIGDKNYKLNYMSFFQINNEIAKQLFDFIKKNVKKNDNVLDAFCGVGAIGIYIADKVNYVIGIESNQNAIDDAIFNAKLNNLTNIEFIQGNVEDTYSNFKDTTTFDVMILDPPRKGLDNQLISLLEKNKPQKIIYTSCDPLTQKRDIKNILDLGYQLKKIRSFDMFPHTFHIENVVIIEKI
ncbi:MAG: 23S rRNA (uracil(1939)-C(5))-methyltransferase RlmD [Candidatus Cloacimonetes bacterium]|nr:23S rRNA (uracil(1939)-C(5))-methyltransferase RlmD [Candidatus Cloacimonadota bacterium]